MLSQTIYDDDNDNDDGDGGDDDDNDDDDGDCEMWVSLMLVQKAARGWVSCHQEASGFVTFIVNIINYCQFVLSTDFF
jgi:hypothetical protein